MHVDVVSFYLFSCFGSFHGFLFWLKKRNKETNISDIEIKISPFCFKKNDLCTLPFPSDHCLNSAPICLTTIWCSVIFLFFRVFAVFLGWFFFEPPQKKCLNQLKLAKKKCVLFFFSVSSRRLHHQRDATKQKTPLFRTAKTTFSWLSWWDFSSLLMPWSKAGKVLQKLAGGVYNGGIFHSVFIISIQMYIYIHLYIYIHPLYVYIYIYVYIRVSARWLDERWNFGSVYDIYEYNKKWVVASAFLLPETNFLPLKMGHPKRNCHLPTTHFQVRTASFKECMCLTKTTHFTLKKRNGNKFFMGCK